MMEACSSVIMPSSVVGKISSHRLMSSSEADIGPDPVKSISKPQISGSALDRATMNSLVTSAAA